MQPQPAQPDHDTRFSTAQDETTRRLAQQRLEDRLHRIRHKILVLSGKGGVGKSTVSVNLAMSLVRAGGRVGLLDVDIHGPSVPTMLGLTHERVLGHEGALVPVEVGELKVMSLGFLLRDAVEAVIWRGPLKTGAIRQFVADVEWGDLDYLVVDAPPGTGDEPLSVCQLMGSSAGAVIVTTPQEVALVSVRKSVSFCRQLGITVLGIVENMGGFICPHCGKGTEIFGSGGGQNMARDMGVPFLGRVPLAPEVTASGDTGRPIAAVRPTTETARALDTISRAIQSAVGETVPPPDIREKESAMRIAIPLADGRLCAHFGHCERFALLDVDPKARSILKKDEVTAPEHQPGLLPAWLAERGANVIIAGGMGQRAQGLFADHQIKVVVGAPAQLPEKLVESYLSGALVVGDNICDH